MNLGRLLWDAYAYAPPACRELIRRGRSLPIAEELHRFVLEHYKTQRPASNVGQARRHLGALRRKRQSY